MKFKLMAITFAMITLFSTQSCVNSDYDLDNLNKDAEFKVPPVPLGSFEKIYLFELKPVGGVNYIVVDTVKNIFSESTIDKFFYDGADDVSIEGKVDVVLKGIATGQVDVTFNIIDEDGTLNTKVRIPNQQITKNANDQPFKILIPSEDMIHMQNAKHLRLLIDAQASTVSFSPEDYIGIKNMVIKTGGINFEF